MRTRRLIAIAALLAAALAVGGCVKKTLTIDSDPPGALVVINDDEVGRTPVTVPFTWYGTYSVRLEAAGCEPLVTEAKVRAPPYQWIGPDLAFETVVPGVHYDTHAFRFALKEARPVDPDSLRERAEGLRRDAKTPAP